jgi:hypothetical protein
MLSQLMGDQNVRLHSLCRRPVVGGRVFPASIEGTIAADLQTPAKVEAIVLLIGDDLRSQGISGVRNGSGISFVNDRRWIFQELFFKRFLIVDSGEFVVSTECIAYRLSTALTLLLYSAILVLPLAFFAATGRFLGVLCVIAFWLLIVGGHYLSTSLRIRRALGRILGQHVQK